MADLLIGVPPFVHAVADVAYIADRQFIYAVGFGKGDGLAAGLVQDSALLAAPANVRRKRQAMRLC